MLSLGISFLQVGEDVKCNLNSKRAKIYLFRWDIVTLCRKARPFLQKRNFFKKGGEAYGYAIIDFVLFDRNIDFDKKDCRRSGYIASTAFLARA